MMSFGGRYWVSQSFAELRRTPVSWKRLEKIMKLPPKDGAYSFSFKSRRVNSKQSNAEVEAEALQHRCAALSIA
jgi:hypothetical protein